MTKRSCPTCGASKSLNAKQCSACANVSRVAKMTGRKYSAERVAASKAGQAAAVAAGTFKRFDIGATTRGKPSPRAVPVGTERVVKDGRVQVRTKDGWRYRSRLVWAEANGPIPFGRVIHHRNEDPMDDRLENLQMMTRSEHARHHKLGIEVR